MNRMIESIKNQRRHFLKLLEQLTRDKTGCTNGDLSGFEHDLFSTEHRTGNTTKHNYYYRGKLLGAESIGPNGYGHYINDFAQRIDNIKCIAGKYIFELDKLEKRLKYKYDI